MSGTSFYDKSGVEIPLNFSVYVSDESLIKDAHSNITLAAPFEALRVLDAQNSLIHYVFKCIESFNNVIFSF